MTDADAAFERDFVAEAERNGPVGKRRPAAAEPGGTRRNPERDFQRACVAWLRQVLPLGSVVAACINEAPAASADPNKRARFYAARKAAGAVAGLPDLVCVLPDGRCAWLELKSPVGRTSDAQDGLHARFRTLGHTVIVARTLEDAEAGLCAAGVRLRGRVGA